VSCRASVLAGVSDAFIPYEAATDRRLEQSAMKIAYQEEMMTLVACEHPTSLFTIAIAVRASLFATAALASAVCYCCANMLKPVFWKPPKFLYKSQWLYKSGACIRVFRGIDTLELRASCVSMLDLYDDDRGDSEGSQQPIRSHGCS